MSEQSREGWWEWCERYQRSVERIPTFEQWLTFLSQEALNEAIAQLRAHGAEI